MNISMNPNGELYQSAVNAPGAIDIPESFLNEARQFRELNMRYACAIREVKTIPDLRRVGAGKSLRCGGDPRDLFVCG